MCGGGEKKEACYILYNMKPHHIWWKDIIFEMQYLFMYGQQEGKKRLLDCCTKDGSTDRHGKPAIKAKTGGWKTGALLLGLLIILLLA